MALLKKFLGNYHSFHRTPPPPHRFLGLLHFYWGTTKPTQSVRPQDTRTHLQYPIWTAKTQIFMALLKKFLGNYHSFHRTPPPPHTFLGLLHFYWDTTKPTQSVRPQDTRTHLQYPIWTAKTQVFVALLKKFIGIYHSFHRTPPPPHTFLGLLHFYWGTTKPTQSVRPQQHTPLNELNLAQLSNFLTHLLLDKWDKKPHPSHLY